MMEQLSKDRTLYFYEQVSQESVSKVAEKILAVNDKDDFSEADFKTAGLQYSRTPIKLYIDSYGGNVYEILGLIGIIERSKTPVHTYVTGTAMSAGFLLLISGHYRYAFPYATVMYHQISDYVAGTLTEIESNLEEGKRLQQVMEGIVLKRTKIQKDTLKKIRDEKTDWYLSAQQALKWGVVDQIC